MRAMRGLLLAAAFLAVPLAGADDATAGKPPKRDPKALQLLKQAVSVYTHAKTLHVELDVETDVQNGSENQQLHSRTSYDLETPNRFAFHTRSVKTKGSGLDYVSDGKTLLVHSLALKQYTESAGPRRLVDLGEKIEAFRRSTTGFLFQNLLTEDPYDSLTDDIIRCAYAGREKVGDIECHHVKVVHPELKWELWIAAKGKPLVHKATTLVAVDEFRVTATETYRNWKVDEPLDKAAFAVTAPPGAAKVDALGSPKKP